MVKSFLVENRIVRGVITKQNGRWHYLFELQCRNCSFCRGLWSEKDRYGGETQLRGYRRDHLFPPRRPHRLHSRTGHELNGWNGFAGGRKLTHRRWHGERRNVKRFDLFVRFNIYIAGKTRMTMRWGRITYPARSTHSYECGRMDVWKCVTSFNMRVVFFIRGAGECLERELPAMMKFFN